MLQLRNPLSYRSLLESLGIDLDEIIFYWEHLCGQDQTEGLFGIIKRNGDVPTMLRYLLTREKHLSERYKQENPDRGYHYFMGKDSYYPTREQTSHSGGGSGGCDGAASSKKKKRYQSRKGALRRMQGAWQKLDIFLVNMAKLCGKIACERHPLRLLGACRM